jgi:fibronectin-binding autotransporter adhesin
MDRQRRRWNGTVIVASAMLAGSTGASTVWWDGPSATWENPTNWSTVGSATTPDPDMAPGAGDAAVFSVDSYTLSNTRRIVTLAADQAVGGMTFRNMGSTVGSGGIGLEPAAGGARTLTLGAGGITLNAGGNLEIRGTANGDFTLALGADQIWRNFEGGNYVFIGSASTGNTALDLAGHTLALTGGNVVTFSSTSPNGCIVDSAGTGGIVLRADGRLRIYNGSGSINNDRIADGIGIASYGGRIENNFHSNTDGNLGETLGGLDLAGGATRYGARRHGSAYSNVFTFGGLARTSETATLVLDGTFENGGYYGTTGDTRNRVLVAGQATTNFLGGWAVYYQQADNASGFLAYSTDEYVGIARGLYANAGTTISTTTSDAAGVYNFNTSRTAAADLLVGALCVNYGYGRSVALGDYDLTIASGGLLFGHAGGSSTSGDYTITATSGRVTAGQTASSHRLFVTSSQPSSNKNTIDAAITDNLAGGTVGLVKSGTGTLTLTKASTYTGDTVINEGTIDLSTAGSITGTPLIEILYGAVLNVSAQATTWTLGTSQRLSGNGTVTGNVAVAGTVGPGSGVGTLTVAGNVAFVSGSVLEIEARSSLLGGDKAEAGYDRLVVNGTVAPDELGTLAVQVLPDAELAEEDLLFVVVNDGTDAVDGVFKSARGAGLTQGATFAADGLGFQISYRGDLATGAFDADSSGNDIVLKVLGPATAPGTVVFLR